MSANAELEATLRRYILGELEDDARLQLEERLVTAPEVFESLGVAEDELVEEYLDDVLPAPERTSFERTFLSHPDREWQVRFVRLLRSKASVHDQVPSRADATYNAVAVSSDAEARTQRATAPDRPGSRWSFAAAGRSARAGAPAAARAGAPTAVAGWFRLQPAWGLAVAAALPILVAGNVWLAMYGARLAGELAHLRAEQSSDQAERQQLRTRVEELSAQARLLQSEVRAARQPRAAVASPPAAAASAQTRTIPTFALATGVLRGEGSLTRIAVPAGSEFVRLRLAAPAIEYPLYRAALEDADGIELWAQSRLEARADATLTVVLPADLLAPGDYQLRLAGSDGRSAPEAVGTYSFRVTHGR